MPNFKYVAKLHIFLHITPHFGEKSHKIDELAENGLLTLITRWFFGKK